MSQSAPITKDVPAQAIHLTPAIATLPANDISTPAQGAMSNAGTSNLIDPLAGLSVSTEVPTQKNIHESVGLSNLSNGTLMDRRALITSGNWNSTDPAGTFYHKYQYPRSLAGSKGFPAADVLKIHEYFNAEAIEFTLQVSASPFSAGALQLIWYPGHTDSHTLLEDASVTDLNKKMIYNGDNMIDTSSALLSIGDGNTVTLIVPITGPNTVLRNQFYQIGWSGTNAQLQFRPENWNFWGSLALKVYNRLQGATADEDQFLTYRLWGRLINPYVALLRPAISTLIPPVRETEGIVMATAGAIAGAIAAGATAAAPAIGTAAAVGAAGLVSAGAGALIDKVGKKCTYYSEVGEAPMVVNMALTNDHRQILSMGYDRKDFHDSHVDLVPTPAEYDVRWIASRRSRFEVASWTSTAVSGTLLATFPLHPFLGVEFTTAEISGFPFTHMRNTNLSMAALLYAYWRGSLTLTIEVVGNAFCRGSLMIHYQPVLKNTRESDMNAITGFPHTVLNIAEVRRVSLRIPYNSVLPWARIPKLNVDNPASPIIELNEILGTVYVQVMNPLRTKGPTDITDLDVNFYIHSDDMDFRYPYITRGISPCYGLPSTEGDTLTGEIIAADNFGPSSDPDPTKLMPTSHTDLAQLLTRRVPIIAHKITTQYTRIRIPFPTVGLRMGAGYIFQNVQWPNPNFYTLLAQCFAWQTGSQTLSIITTNASSASTFINAQVIYNGDEDWDDRFSRSIKIESTTEDIFAESSSDDAGISMNLAVNSRQELGIPWYNLTQMLPANVNFVPKTLNDTLSPGYMPFAVVDLYIKSVVGTIINLSTSVGPNFQFSQFMGAPQNFVIYDPVDPVRKEPSKKFKVPFPKVPMVSSEEWSSDAETEGSFKKRQQNLDVVKCTICGVLFNTPNSRVRHMIASHPHVPDMFKCDYCGKKGSTLNWDDHNSKCKMLEAHKCHLCPLELKDGERYLNHVRNAHCARGQGNFAVAWEAVTGRRYASLPMTEMFSGFSSFSDVADSISSIKEAIETVSADIGHTSNMVGAALPEPEKISETLDAFNATNKQTCETLKDVSATQKSLDNLLKTTSGSITQITDKLTSILERFSNNIPPTAPDLKSKARYIANWTRAFKSRNFEPVFSDILLEVIDTFSPIDPAITALLLKVALTLVSPTSCIHDTLNALLAARASDFVSPLWDQVKEWLYPQTEADENEYVSFGKALLTLIAFGFTVVVGACSPGTFFKSLKDMFSFINISRATASFGSVIEAILKLKQWIEVKFFGKSDLDGYDWIVLNRTQVVILQQEYLRFQDFTLNKILNTPVLRNEAIKQGDFAKLLFDNISKIKTGSNELTMLKQQAEYFINMARQSRLAPPTKVRPSPVVVTFQGDSQVGKTFLAATALPHYIHKLMGWPDEPVFMISSATDNYMSGYSQQMTTMLDDFLQMKDGKDLAGFVNMVGNAPYRVNMAALDEKGTQFLSQLLILTINDPHPKVDKFVNEPSAIYNRIYKHYFHVRPKPEYSLNGVLNGRKVAQEGLKNPDDFLEFYRAAYVLNRTTGQKERVPKIDDPLGGIKVTFKTIVKETLLDIKESERIAKQTNEEAPKISSFPEMNFDDDSDFDQFKSDEESEDEEDEDEIPSTEAFSFHQWSKGWNMPRKINASIQYIARFVAKLQNFGIFDKVQRAANPGTKDEIDQAIQCLKFLASIDYSDNILMGIDMDILFTILSRAIRKNIRLEFSRMSEKEHKDETKTTTWWHLLRDKKTPCVEIVFIENPDMNSEYYSGFWKLLNSIFVSAKRLWTRFSNYMNTWGVIGQILRLQAITMIISIIAQGVVLTISSGVMWLCGIHPSQIEDKMQKVNDMETGTVNMFIEEYPFIMVPAPGETPMETMIFENVINKRYDAFVETIDREEARKRGERLRKEFIAYKNAPKRSTIEENLSFLEENLTESYYSAGNPTGGKKGKVKLVTPKPGKPMKEEFTTESDVPPMFDILKRNTVKLTSKAGSIRALGWKNDIVIVNRHFVSLLGDQDEITMTRWTPNTATEREENVIIKFRKSSVATMEYEDSRQLDLCLWKLGWKQGAFKDISTHFIREADFENVTGQSGFRMSNIITTIENMQFVAEQVVYDAPTGAFQTYPVSIVARGPRSPGLCGSPWIVTNNSLFGNVGKIVGIHSFGVEGMMGATPISIEGLLSVEGALPQSKTPSQPTTEMDHDENYETPLVYHKFHGVIPIQQAFYQPRKTEIKPSPVCNEIFPVTHQPAVLSKNDKRLEDPESFNLKLFQKTDQPTKWFRGRKEEQIYAAARQIVVELNELPRDVEPRKLTLHEAINGVDGQAYMEDSGLEMRNSPGYPYNRKPGRGKFPYFEPLPQKEGERLCYKISDPALLARIDERIELAQKGIVPPNSIWLDVMKDELRKNAKIREGATRIVNAPPLDLMIVWNIYFGAFRLMFMNPKNIGTKLESALGVDPKVAWPEIALQIKKAKHAFGVDYSSFDSSQNAEFYKIIVEIINDWYSQNHGSISDNEVRRTLFFEVGHTLHLFGDQLYTDDHGLPSGVCGGFTTITNIMVNKLISRVAFQRCGLHVSLFKKYVGAIFMGDDNLQWVHDDPDFTISNRLKGYNRITLAEVAEEIGMTVTMPNKSKDLTPYDAFEDLSFLKCGFGDNVIKGYFLPTMEESTIHNLINWYRPKHNPDQFRTNIIEACKFAAPHGAKFYKNFTDALKENAKIRSLFPDYDTLIPNFETIFYSTYLPFGLQNPEEDAGALFSF